MNDSRSSFSPSPVMIKAVLNLAAFIVIGSVLTLFVLDPGSEAFPIAVISLIIGVGLGLMSIPLIRSHRKSIH